MQITISKLKRKIINYFLVFQLDYTNRSILLLILLLTVLILIKQKPYYEICANYVDFSPYLTSNLNILAFHGDDPSVEFHVIQCNIIQTQVTC